MSQVSFGQIHSDAHAVGIQIPEVAVLDLEPNNAPIQFSFDAPTEAGKSITLAVNKQTKWLNYTCAMGEGASARSVYIELADGELPEGISLGVSIGNATGGAGQLGSPTGSISLSPQPRMIISGIGRSYTGNGENAGHPIEYSLSISDYSKLETVNGASIKVMVTITD